jgi:hypothetical protein
MKYEEQCVHGFAMMFAPSQAHLILSANAALGVRENRPPNNPHEESLRAGTARQGRGGVTPLDPESPHAYWLRQNRAAFADSGVGTPALVAPHPCVDWRGDIHVSTWFPWHRNALITHYQ